MVKKIPIPPCPRSYLFRFGGVYSPPFLQDWVPWTIVKRLSWNRDNPMEGGIDRESKEEQEKRKLRAERYEEGYGEMGGRERVLGSCATVEM